MSDLTGHYTVVFSPDDEANSGKGYYAEFWDYSKTSPSYRTAIQADAWARKRGGSISHGGQGDE